MKAGLSIVSAMLLACVLVGCSNTPAEQEKEKSPNQKTQSGDEEKIKTALDKLSPEDRKLAEAQKFCPIHTGERLGSMGKPIKIEVEGKPVFLCCSGCKSAAAKDEQGTLKKVEKLIAANK